MDGDEGGGDVCVGVYGDGSATDDGRNHHLDLTGKGIESGVVRAQEDGGH